MKVHTNYRIHVSESFTFWGENNNDLGIGDCVYLWQERNRSGLGDEIVYGTAVVVEILDNSYYKAVRIDA